MAREKRKRDIYQEVTDKILDFIERGNLPPWRHPIKGRGTGDGWPKSLTTGSRYRGVNVFLLAITSWIEGYTSDYWLTFNQAKKEGATVKKGEKASLVVFWKQYTKTDEESGEEITLPVLRHYNVFNAEQCDDLIPPDASDDQQPSLFDPIGEAEKIVEGFKNPPLIEHCGRSAAYFRQTDKIKIASPEWFTSSESYYATLFHEMAHSTGHEKRLNRKREEGTHVFGSPSYSREELVAEFGSAFLCASAGISPPTIEQSATYIDGWRKKLKDEKKLVVQAAGLGQRAADYILGVSYDAASNDVMQKVETRSRSRPLTDAAEQVPDLNGPHSASGISLKSPIREPQGLLGQTDVSRPPPGCGLMCVGTEYVEAMIAGGESIDAAWRNRRIDQSEATRLAHNWITAASEKVLVAEDSERERANILLKRIHDVALHMQRVQRVSCDSSSPDFRPP